MLKGVLAEFDSPETLVAAYERLRSAGYTRLRTWTPYPVHGVLRNSPQPVIGWIMLCSGAVGGVFAYALQWWCNARDYPLIVGGRPLNSIPAFIPITFETTVLFSALAGFVAMLALSGLPRLYHPVFGIRGFDRATVDRFWIGVDASDPRFEGGIDDELANLGALRCERLEAGP